MAFEYADSSDVINMIGFCWNTNLLCLRQLNAKTNQVDLICLGKKKIRFFSVQLTTMLVLISFSEKIIQIFLSKAGNLKSMELTSADERGMINKEEIKACVHL